MKKLVLLLMLIVLMGTVNAALLYEDFSSYTDFSWLGPDATNPGPSGWFLAGQDEGIKTLISDLSAEPVGMANGTNTGLKIAFGTSSAEKDTNLGWKSPTAEVFLANTVYTFSFDIAVGQGETDDIVSMLMGGGELLRDTQLDIKPANGWVHVDIVVDTATYTTAVGNVLQLQFNMDGGQVTALSEGGDTVYLSNIQIVPEPATIALLGLGSLALIRRRK